MNNILVFTPAYKEQTSQNMADFIKFCKDDLTLFNPNFNWDDKTKAFFEHQFHCELKCYNRLKKL